MELMAATRGALILLLCFACVGLAQTVSTGKTVRRHRVAEPSVAPAVQRAEAAIDKADYAAAEQALNEALKQAPNDYRAWFDLGFVYTAMKRDAEAIEAYRKSVAADPKVFESNLNLGLMLARGKSPEAEKYLRAATELKPSAHVEEGLARAWVSLGHVIEDKEPQQALAAFQRAARLQPKDPEPHISAALVAQKLGDFAIAEDEYQATAALDPKSSEALAGLVSIYAKTSRLRDAEAALHKYLALVPDSAAAHLQLGRVLEAQGKNDQAITELETGLRLAPNDFAAQRDLASLYAADNQYQKAESMFRALVQQDPRNAALRHAFAGVLLQQRKFAEAQAELLQTVKLDPALGEAYGDLAVAASENQDYALTIKALDARARLLPELPATYFLRATAYDHLRNYEQAAANYHQFLLVAEGRFPDQEWQARHRLVAIEPKKK
jgi:tetratricopeptide (TPR) repeat protein